MKTNELFPASANTFLSKKHLLNHSIFINKGISSETNKIAKGIELLKCDYTTSTNKSFSLNYTHTDKYVFVFNLNENLRISLNRKKKISLPTLHNLIVFKKAGTDIEFYMKAERAYKACIFVIDANNLENYVKEFFAQDATAFFTKNEVVHLTVPNMKITDYVNRLLKEYENSFPNNLISLGYINIIIGSLLNHWIDTQKGTDKPKSCMREWEIAKLHKITEQIRKNPEHNYPIKSLSRETGINIPKLQEGFKEMHGHTISNYIREMRLLKAEELLKNSDLNISEIVYSVGLCSRSYFSRIFKRKYKCTPSDFQRKKISFS